MGFQPRLSQPRQKSSGTTSPMYHMHLGAVHVYEGRGRDSRHEAQGAEAKADCESWSYVQVDYFFMKYRDEEVAQPYLSAIDSRYGRCLAVKCVTKGSQDEYAVKALEIFCRQLGAEKFFPTVGLRAQHSGRGWTRCEPKFQEVWLGSPPSRVNSLWGWRKDFMQLQSPIAGFFC